MQVMFGNEILKYRNKVRAIKETGEILFVQQPSQEPVFFLLNKERIPDRIRLTFHAETAAQRMQSSFNGNITVSRQ